MTTVVTGSVDVPELNDSETPGGDEHTLTEDDVFHVLQNERRRLVLKYLEGREEAVRMRDVAEQVAAWEHDTTVRELDSTQRQRVYIPLYQNHLPKLDEKGLIEYNQSRGIVERTDLADQLRPYLDPFEYVGESGAADAEADAGESFPWELPYFGVATGGSFLMLGKAWSLPLLGAVAVFPLAVLVLVLLSATSGAQLVSERLVGSGPSSRDSSAV